MYTTSSIDRETNHNDPRFVYCKIDCIRGSISSVPTPSLTCFCESVSTCFYRLNRIKSINLWTTYTIPSAVENLSIASNNWNKMSNIYMLDIKHSFEWYIIRRDFQNEATIWGKTKNRHQKQLKHSSYKAWLRKAVEEKNNITLHKL